jgi:DNA-binding MarR family transcriptional regulator
MSEPRGGALEPELDDLIEATVSLFHRLRATTETVHGPEALTAARRGVLQGLRRQGPQTVPQLARARAVSRQHVQALVNDLTGDGLVELRENPAHKRSRLVRLTSAGEDALAVIEQREAEVFGAVGRTIDPWRLREAAEVLTELQEELVLSRRRESDGK